MYIIITNSHMKYLGDRGYEDEWKSTHVTNYPDEAIKFTNYLSALLYKLYINHKEKDIKLKIRYVDKL